MIVEHPSVNGTRRVLSRASEQASLRISGGTSKSASQTRPRNRVLGALPQELWARLAPHVGHALLIQNRPLHEANNAVEQVYFPNGGLISLVVDSHNGAKVEAGVVGREGIVGVFEALCDTPPTQRAVVQIAGTACWLPAAVFRAEFRRGGEFQEWILRYMQALHSQAAQCALCNRLHSVEERLARWLLMTRDRMAHEEIPITHEAIAHLLGTRRSSITVALGSFEMQEMLRCARGRLEVLDADRLRDSSCECYAALQKHEVAPLSSAFAA